MSIWPVTSASRRGGESEREREERSGRDGDAVAIIPKARIHTAKNLELKWGISYDLLRSLLRFLLSRSLSSFAPGSHPRSIVAPDQQWAQKRSNVWVNYSWTALNALTKTANSMEFFTDLIFLALTTRLPTTRRCVHWWQSWYQCHWTQVMCALTSETNSLTC